jgi:hypothetical protein
MTITNNTGNDWTVGLHIPAGATITMDVPKIIAMQKNARAFLDAHIRGDLLMKNDSTSADVPVVSRPAPVSAPSSSPAAKKDVAPKKESSKR